MELNGINVLTPINGVLIIKNAGPPRPRSREQTFHARGYGKSTTQLRLAMYAFEQQALAQKQATP